MNCQLIQAIWLWDFITQNGRGYWGIFSDREVFFFWQSFSHWHYSINQLSELFTGSKPKVNHDTFIFSCSYWMKTVYLSLKNLQQEVNMQDTIFSKFLKSVLTVACKHRCIFGCCSSQLREVTARNLSAFTGYMNIAYSNLPLKLTMIQ